MFIGKAIAGQKQWVVFSVEIIVAVLSGCLFSLTDSSYVWGDHIVFVTFPIMSTHLPYQRGKKRFLDNKIMAKIYFWLFIYFKSFSDKELCAYKITVIVVENGISGPSSNPGQGHFRSTPL